VSADKAYLSHENLALVEKLSTSRCWSTRSMS
jgi:hypothetical protein